MSKSTLPIEAHRGIQLVACETPGVSRAEVLNRQEVCRLPWDRFMRLKVSGDYICRTSPGAHRVLDVGGFDGALALFLPGYEVHVVDPATTGGSGLELPLADSTYDIVVAVDVIEHLPQEKRSSFIGELTRVAGQSCYVSFPNNAAMPAQKLVWSLTGNKFVKEHIDYGLPDKDWVVSRLTSSGFKCEVVPNTNLAIWVAQYTLANLAPDAAQKVSHYLTQTHDEEPFSIPLYYLIVGIRNKVIVKTNTI